MYKYAASVNCAAFSEIRLWKCSIARPNAIGIVHFSCVHLRGSITSRSIATPRHCAYIHVSATLRAAAHIFANSAPWCVTRGKPARVYIYTEREPQRSYIYIVCHTREDYPIAVRGTHFAKGLRASVYTCFCSTGV